MPNPVEFSIDSLVRAYVACRGNQVETAERLGVDRRTVAKYLRSKEGQERLARYTADVLDQYHVSAMRVVGEAAAIAFSDLPRILQDGATIETLNQLEAHHRAAVAAVECDREGNIVKIRMHPKMEALKVLAVYAEIAGLGAVPQDAPDGTSSGRGELGGLHITGPSKEVTTDEARPIPRPERVD